MSFLHPRTIKIFRLTPVNTTVGLGEYSHIHSNQEILVDEGIPASIEAARTGRQVPDNLPQGAAYRSFYTISFKGRRDLCLLNDIIQDELGNRYQVTSPNWSSLGHEPLCELLEI